MNIYSQIDEHDLSAAIQLGLERMERPPHINSIILFFRFKLMSPHNFIIPYSYYVCDMPTENGRGNGHESPRFHDVSFLLWTGLCT